MAKKKGEKAIRNYHCIQKDVDNIIILSENYKYCNTLYDISPRVSKSTWATPHPLKIKMVYPLETPCRCSAFESYISVLTSLDEAFYQELPPLTQVKWVCTKTLSIVMYYVLLEITTSIESKICAIHLWCDQSIIRGLFHTRNPNEICIIHILFK